MMGILPEVVNAQNLGGVNSSEKIKLIQINLNHCRVVQDLLAQTTYESVMEIAFISESYRNLDGGIWVTDPTGRTAIWPSGREVIQYGMGQAVSGFVWAKIGGIFVYSYYALPSLTLPEFEDLLDDLFHNVRGRGPKVIVGDFHAWAIEAKKTNARCGWM